MSKLFLDEKIHDRLDAWSVKAISALGVPLENYQSPHHAARVAGPCGRHHCAGARDRIDVLHHYALDMRSIYMRFVTVSELRLRATEIVREIGLLSSPPPGSQPSCTVSFAHYFSAIFASNSAQNASFGFRQ